jgi:hypothetical protein
MPPKIEDLAGLKRGVESNLPNGKAPRDLSPDGACPDEGRVQGQGDKLNNVSTGGKL